MIHNRARILSFSWPLSTRLNTNFWYLLGFCWWMQGGELTIVGFRLVFHSKDSDYMTLLCPKRLLLRQPATLLFVFAVMWANLAQGQTVNGLYQASVAIENQSTRQVQAAKKTAFASVLVKVTGQAMSLNNAKLRQALSAPEDYLQRFSFATQVIDGQEKAVLKLTFDPLRVNQLITTAGMTVWGAERAAVLVWLVAENHGKQRLVNDDRHPVVAQIKAQSEARGLPLVWPLLDLDDQLAIDAGALWGLFRDPIMSASLRYQADAILIGRVYKGGQQQWQVKWSFWLDNSEQQWASQGANLAQLITPLQERLATSLVAKFALPNKSEAAVGLAVGQQVLVEIDQVANLADYAHIQALMEGVSGVSHVQLYAANGTQLVYRLFADGHLSQVKSTLELKRRLLPVENEDSARLSLTYPLWRYVWR